MTTEAEELDIISAVWIMASNDENSLITYEGIRHRLSLPPSLDVKALIRKRGELFRPGTNAAHLEEWRTETLAGRRLPSWIRILPTEEARQAAIKGLTVDDLFRSQFRTTRRAERSPIEIIKWGLDHIDRLRKARLEAREATAKSWQMWLIFAATVAGIITQIVVAWIKKGP